jgi:hypothetical protein
MIGTMSGIAEVDLGSVISADCNVQAVSELWSIQSLYL